jgi:hypothetical protein
MTVITMGWTGHTDTQRWPLDSVPALMNFLNQRSLQNARTQNRSKTSLEELKALSDKLNSSGCIKPMDTDATKSNIYSIKNIWWLVLNLGLYIVLSWLKQVDIAYTKVKRTSVERLRTAAREKWWHSSATSVRTIRWIRRIRSTNT